MQRRKFIKNTGILLGGSTLLTSITFQETEKQNKLLAKALVKGDLIALTAPAGALSNESSIERIEKRMKELGFKTIRGKSLTEREGYLAGTDENRAKEINEFFENKDVKAILTMRGGWGCARILDLLDYDLIKKNPKVIMGFSDITSLIIGIYQKTGLITFHGPTGSSSWKEYSTKNVFKTLVNGEKYILENPSDYKQDLETLSPGKAYGELMGGNLTVVVSLIGTPYEPDWNQKILFLEDTDEEPYRIDRMLWQLKLAGVFKKVNGIVLGGFTKCEPEEPEKSFSLNEVFEQHFKDISIPVYKGAAFGHILPKFNLPIGVLAEINADNKTIALLESCVKF